MNRQSSPTRVTMPPPVVPGFIVTYSRIALRRPIVKRRRLAAIFQILRLEPDRGERKNARSLADRRTPVDDDVRSKAHPGASVTCSPMTQYGADRDILGQPCARRDDRRGVDLRHRELA